MNNDNNQTTRVKKYEDLRNEIKNMDESGVKKGKSVKKTTSATTTIPINNNEGIDTVAINTTVDSKDNKKVETVPIFKSYQTKKIIVTVLYILAALGILCLVIALIIWMVKTL
jgi:cadmium resistance protein CadD (predicted permease)